MMNRRKFIASLAKGGALAGLFSYGAYGITKGSNITANDHQEDEYEQQQKIEKINELTTKYEIEDPAVAVALNDAIDAEYSKLNDILAKYAATGAFIGSAGRSLVHEHQKKIFADLDTKPSMLANPNGILSRALRLTVPTGAAHLASFPIDYFTDPLKNSPLISEDHLTKTYGLTKKNAAKFAEDIKDDFRMKIHHTAINATHLQEIGNFIHNPTFSPPEKPNTPPQQEEKPAAHTLDA